MREMSSDETNKITYQSSLWAIKENLLENVKELMDEKSVLLDAYNEEYEVVAPHIIHHYPLTHFSLFHFAVLCGDQKMIEYFQEQKADPFLTNNHSHTVVSQMQYLKDNGVVSFSEEQVEAMKRYAKNYLIQKYQKEFSDISDAIYKEKETDFFALVSKTSLPVDTFCDEDLAFSKRVGGSEREYFSYSVSKFSLFHLAVFVGNSKIIAYFRDQNANPCLQNDQGHTVYQQMDYLNKTGIVKFSEQEMRVMENYEKLYKSELDKKYQLPKSLQDICLETLINTYADSTVYPPGFHFYANVYSQSIQFFSEAKIDEKIYTSLESFPDKYTPYKMSSLPSAIFIERSHITPAIPSSHPSHAKQS